MNSNTEKIKKEIQKIIYQDLEIWKQQINDLENGTIDKNTFKRNYVEFLQKIEEKITHFTLFFLKKESHLISNQVFQHNLKKTALIETIIEFLSEPIIEKDRIIHKKFQSSSSAITRDDSQLLYSASETD